MNIETLDVSDGEPYDVRFCVDYGAHEDSAAKTAVLEDLVQPIEDMDALRSIDHERIILRGTTDGLQTLQRCLAKEKRLAEMKSRVCMALERAETDDRVHSTGA